MRALFKAIVATAALAAPMYANAIPMTWHYSGTCTGGDCGLVPQIEGTLTGDPTLDTLGPLDDNGHLTEYLIGEVLSYSFLIGGNPFSGDVAWGAYRLNSLGNIVDGTMSFGTLGLTLRIGDVSDAQWSFDCSFFLCGRHVDAYGSGSYTNHATSVPEPATLSLLGLGLLAFGFARRRRV